MICHVRIQFDEKFPQSQIDIQIDVDEKKPSIQTLSKLAESFRTAAKRLVDLSTAVNDTGFSEPPRLIYGKGLRNNDPIE